MLQYINFVHLDFWHVLYFWKTLKLCSPQVDKAGAMFVFKVFLLSGYLNKKHIGFFIWKYLFSKKSTGIWTRTRSGFSYPTMISAAADRSNDCDEWRLPASWSSCRRRWCWTWTCCSWWPRWSDWHKPGRSCLCLQSVHGRTTDEERWFVAVTGRFKALLRAFSPYKVPYKLFILIKC